MHTVFALLCFVVVIHWLIFPYPSGLLHWHCGNLTIAPVSAKQPWWIWIKTSCEYIMNDCITTTKQSTTKPCAYFLGYTVWYQGCKPITYHIRELSVWIAIMTRQRPAKRPQCSQYFASCGLPTSPTKRRAAIAQTSVRNHSNQNPPVLNGSDEPRATFVVETGIIGVIWLRDYGKW